MALQDIRHGRGVCVIDPTGDLVSRLVHWIPKSRAKETIYFDTDFPVPIDFCSYRNPAERQVFTDQLMSLFDLTTAPISRPRLLRIFGTLFDANDVIKEQHLSRPLCTFLDVLRFIEDEKWRTGLLKIVPHREPQWTPFPKPIDTVSIVERMTPFTEAPTVRAIFNDPQPRLNIWAVMQEKKILLVNLKDTPTDLFVGSLIVAKIQQATFGRRYIPEAKRTPYYLYVDECGTIMEFAAKEFKTILLRARKYKLCLTIANQIESDLPKDLRAKISTIQT